MLNEWELKGRASKMIDAGLTEEQLMSLVTDEILLKHVRHSASEFAAHQSCWRDGRRDINKALGNYYREPRGKWCILVNRDMTFDVRDIDLGLAGKIRITVIVDNAPVPIHWGPGLAMPEERRARDYELTRWSPGDFHIYLERK